MEKFDEARRQYHRDTLESVRFNDPVNWHEIHSQIIDYCNALPGNEVHLLDAGAGEGRYEEILKDVVGLKYVGVDSGVASDDWNFSKVIDGDITSMDFLENESIDVIILIQVLSHVPDLESVITELQRVLKPNGRIFISTQNMQSLTHVPYDFRRLTCYGIANLIKSKKLTMIRVTPLLYGDLVSSSKQLLYALKNSLYIKSSRNVLKRTIMRFLVKCYPLLEFTLRKLENNKSMPLNPIGYFIILEKNDDK